MTNSFVLGITTGLLVLTAYYLRNRLVGVNILSRVYLSVSRNTQKLRRDFHANWEIGRLWIEKSQLNVGSDLEHILQGESKK